MAHLSSCYFCGSALDSRLQLYEVAASADSGTEATVTLCPSCHQKLDTILDTAGMGTVDVTETGASMSVPESQSVETTAADGTASEPVVEDTAGEVDTDLAGEDAGGDGGEDPTATAAGDGESPSRDESDAAASESTAEDTATGGTTDETDAEPSASGVEDDADDILLDPEFDESEETEEWTETPAENTPQEHPEATAREKTDEGGSDGTGPAESGTGESQPTETNQDTSEPTATSGGENADEDGSGATARTSISALEYNKVMRLLQNRDFPIQRAEIVTVAANAYDLAESECAQVIDLAVDRGLLREDGGQLFRPANEE